MSQRDGHATGGAGAPSRPADVPASGSGGPRPWEDVYPSLPPHQQSQLLDLAGRQGFLLAEQIPPTPPQTGAVRTVLQHALAGRLPPVPLADPGTRFDPDLDQAQFDAACRAAQTPDLFVVQGPAGTGKTRVAVEVVRQVASRGGRVLYLSPDAPSIDDVVPRLAGLPELTVLRRLAPGESADRLPPVVASLTPARREAATRETLVRRASESLAAAEDRVRRAELIGPVWDELTALRARQASRAAEMTALTANQDSLADEVCRDAEAGGHSVPFYVQRLRGITSAFAKRTTAFDEQTAELASTRAAAEDRLRSAEAECRALRPLADALTAGRWYAPTFWRAKLDKDVPSRLAEAEARLAAAKLAMDELAVGEQKLAADRRLAEEEHAADRARLIDAEVARRRAELADRIAQIEQAAATDGSRETELVSVVHQAGIDPAGGRSAVDAELAAARGELEFARGWAADVQSHADELARDACGPVNVIAGPVAGIGSDPNLAGESFDLLVVDDAHRLSESDFLAAARLACRWVLVGEPTPLAAGRHRNPRPDLFARLAPGLAHDVWVRDGNRLVCRLHPVRGADRRRLECEPVVDSPDIELRMLAPADGDPILAEVAFPEATAAAAAREYLCRELGEVTCQPWLRTPVWESSAGGPTLRFGPPDARPAFAEIGPGVREELAGLDTCAVHFGPDWSLERAQQWAAEHVGRREPGRFVTLGKPYRACPGLARWLNRAFASGFAVAATGDDGPHVEFLAVPDTHPRHRRDHGRSGRVGGAGYEIDLSDPRQRAALPPELADLPQTGFVNVPEAQALVRYLEPFAGPNVAVTSPFPSQAAVLRKLLARSPRLAAIRVLDPADAARAECDVLAVSLTRSHVARAVPFGDAPAVLAGLLARARKKVLFAGDPGTLARRLQWEGPVDHLDAAEAARERAWVAALADCPRVTGPRPRPSPAESVGS